VYQTAVGRHGDRTRTAESSAVRNRARYHCAVGPAIEEDSSLEWLELLFVFYKAKQHTQRNLS